MVGKTGHQGHPCGSVALRGSPFGLSATPLHFSTALHVVGVQHFRAIKNDKNGDGWAFEGSKGHRLLLCSPCISWPLERKNDMGTRINKISILNNTFDVTHS
jgi:hypothetical protein